MTGISAVAVACYCARHRTIRGPIVLAFISFAVFHVCMATATASSNNAVWGYPVILGLGMGLALTCIVTVAQLSTPPDLIAIATGLLFALRSLGGSVALAVYTAIFNSVLHNHMASEVPAAVVPLEFDPRHMAELVCALQSNNVSLAMQVPTATPDIVSAALHGSQLTYLTAFRSSWIAAAVFAAATALAACFIVNPENAFTADADAPLAHESHSSEVSVSRV
ncbi:hypothetical protein BJY00DRAFT_73595 [Aspergillus carlsbadensis]|nr:hypothetical protein BJY00DRAFT_73595 [Aspergillus carlsbadensis]